MDMHELVGAYALDALSDEEREAFEAHLATCEPCQAELASLADVLDGLADDGTVVDVPAGLAERIAAELAVTPQDVVVARPTLRSPTLPSPTLRSPRWCPSASAAWAGSSPWPLRPLRCSSSPRPCS